MGFEVFINSYIYLKQNKISLSKHYMKYELKNTKRLEIGKRLKIVVKTSEEEEKKKNKREFHTFLHLNKKSIQ